MARLGRAYWRRRHRSWIAPRGRYPLRRSVAVTTFEPHTAQGSSGFRRLTRAGTSYNRVNRKAPAQPAVAWDGDLRLRRRCSSLFRGSVFF
ncbi:MAG TPA: hypothetical protein VIJ34_10815 [Acidimicrobiales bacterium]